MVVSSAWTSPAAFTVGEEATAAGLNTNIIDNLEYLYGMAPQVGESLVTTDSNGNATINYPVAYPYPYVPAVIAQQVTTSPTGTPVAIAIYAPGGNGFQIHTSAASSSLYIFWMAK